MKYVNGRRTGLVTFCVETVLRRVIEGKIQGGIEVTGRQGRRRTKLLDDVKERRGYSHLNEKALDRTMWRARFGRGFGPVVRQTAKSIKSILHTEIKVYFIVSNNNAYVRIICVEYDNVYLHKWILGYYRKLSPVYSRNMITFKLNIAAASFSQTLVIYIIQGDVFQETTIFVITAGRTSNLAKRCLYLVFA
jgi:hypothetical protein